MLLLKFLMVLIYFSFAISYLYFPYIYSFAISPHTENLHHLISMLIPLIYICLPIRIKKYKQIVYYSKLISAVFFIIFLLGDLTNGSWKIFCLIILSMAIFYLYLPTNFTKDIYLLRISKLTLCIFFISISAFSLYLPVRLSISHYIESHQNYTKYVDILPVLKTAILTKNGYDETLNKHMTEETFNRLNTKKLYPNFDHFSTFQLTELYQKQDDNDPRIIYVDTYSIFIAQDENNEHAYLPGGYSYAQFTILLKDDSWYILAYDSPLKESDWR